MSNLSLEEQVERLEFAANIYREISGSDDKKLILSGLKLLEASTSKIVDKKRIHDWITNFNKGQRDDFEIAEHIGYYIFSELFDKESLDFLYLKVNLGLSVLDLYLKKTKGKKSIKITRDPDIGSYEAMLLNPFLELCGCILIDKSIAEDNPNLPDEEKKIWDDIFNINWVHGLAYLKDYKGINLDEDMQKLIEKGYGTIRNSHLFSVTKYKRAKRHYKKALNLCAKKWKKTRKELLKNPMTKLKLEKGIKDEETSPFRLHLAKYGYFSDLILDLISHSNGLHAKQKRLYNESVLVLNQKFPITNNLSYSKLEQLYENLSSLQDEVFKRESQLIPTQLIEDSNSSLLAFKNHYSRLIKLLKKKRICSKRDKLLSKTYTSYSYYTPQERNYLNKAIALDETNLQTIYGLAKYHEYHDDEKKALEMWNKLIEVYFGKIDKIDLKKFKDATNEVGKIIDENLEHSLFHPLIIKRSKKDMSKEYILMINLYEKSSNKNAIPKPIVYIQYKDGFNYLIMRETETKWGEKADEVKTLAEIVDHIHALEFNERIMEKIDWVSEEEIFNTFKNNYLKNSLNNLIQFQKQLTLVNPKEKGQSFKKIEHKISKRINASQTLTTALGFLIEKIDKQKKCLSHGDFHPGNILIKQNRGILLDFEYVGYMPLLYDVFFLLDNPSLSLDCDTKEELAKFYLRGKNIEFDESWKKDFDYMSLFVNLRWAGISSKWTNLTNDKKYTTLRLMSLKKSEKTIDKMLTYTSNIEYSNLQKLKNCLKELY